MLIDHVKDATMTNLLPLLPGLSFRCSNFPVVLYALPYCRFAEHPGQQFERVSGEDRNWRDVCDAELM